jgi:hypothetical protein
MDLLVWYREEPHHANKEEQQQQAGGSQQGPEIAADAAYKPSPLSAEGYSDRQGESPRGEEDGGLREGLREEQKEDPGLGHERGASWETEACAVELAELLGDGVL